MIDERYEFEISQLADGTLASDRAAALRLQMASDADASALLASYEKMDAALGHLPPMPAIDWDRMRTQIATHIDTAGIDSEPASYPMPWLNRAIALAVAACVLIATGVAIRSLPFRPLPSHSVAPRGQIAVAGPSIEPPAGNVIREITIGPSAVAASAGFSVQYGDAGVVVQPQRVVIASAADAAQDNESDSPATPY